MWVPGSMEVEWRSLGGGELRVGGMLWGRRVDVG